MRLLAISYKPGDSLRTQTMSTKFHPCPPYPVPRPLALRQYSTVRSPILSPPFPRMCEFSSSVPQSERAKRGSNVASDRVAAQFGYSQRDVQQRFAISRSGEAEVKTAQSSSASGNGQKLSAKPLTEPPLTMRQITEIAAMQSGPTSSLMGRRVRRHLGDFDVRRLRRAAGQQLLCGVIPRGDDRLRE